MTTTKSICTIQSNVRTASNFIEQPCEMKGECDKPTNRENLYWCGG